MKKTTTEKAVVAYRILNNAKLGKMKDEDKFLVVRAMKQLRPVATDYDDFIKDAAERLKPEGIEAIQEKVQSNATLSEEERKVWEKYNQDVTKCVQDELAKEKEFTFEALGDEGLKGLLASNDFAVAEIMALDEVIGE